MHQAPVRRSDPQTAIAIAEQSTGTELPDGSWKWIGLDLSFNEPPDSACAADQECAVIVFSQTLNAVRLAWQRIEFWGPGFPSPQPVLHSRPETALAVLIQIERAVAQSAVLSVALDAAVPNRAEPSGRNAHTAGPYRAFTILEDPVDVPIRQAPGTA